MLHSCACHASHTCPSPDPDSEETNGDGDVYPGNQAVHNANNLTADPDALTESQRHNPGQTKYQRLINQ